MHATTALITDTDTDNFVATGRLVATGRARQRLELDRTTGSIQAVSAADPRPTSLLGRIRYAILGW